VIHLETRKLGYSQAVKKATRRGREASDTPGDQRRRFLGVMEKKALATSDTTGEKGETLVQQNVSIDFGSGPARQRVGEVPIRELRKMGRSFSSRSL